MRPCFQALALWSFTTGSSPSRSYPSVPPGTCCRLIMTTAGSPVGAFLLSHQLLTMINVAFLIVLPFPLLCSFTSPQLALIDPPSSCLDPMQVKASLQSSTQSHHNPTRLLPPFRGRTSSVVTPYMSPVLPVHTSSAPQSTAKQKNETPLPYWDGRNGRKTTL